MPAKAELRSQSSRIEGLIKNPTTRGILLSATILGISAIGGAKAVESAGNTQERPDGLNIGATAEFIDQNYQEQNKLLGSQDFQTNIADLNEIVQNAPINKLVSPTQEPVSAPQTVEVPIDSLTIQVPAGGTVNGAVIEAVKNATGVDMRAVDPSGATDWRLTQ